MLYTTSTTLPDLAQHAVRGEEDGSQTPSTLTAGPPFWCPSIVLLCALTAQLPAEVLVHQACTVDSVSLAAVFNYLAWTPGPALQLLTTAARFMLLVPASLEHGCTARRSAKTQ